MLDARGGGLYHARYERTNSGVSPLVAPRVVPSEELDELLKDSRLALVDQSLEPRVTAREGLQLKFGATPDATSVLAIAQHKIQDEDRVETEPVLPLYLRPFEGRVRKR